MRRFQRIAAISFVSVLLSLLGACDGLLGVSGRSLVPNLVCGNGACECSAGFADCNQDDADGCEADLSDINSCGGCNHVCSNGTCQDGACLCSPSYGDCDTDMGNGCETDLRLPTSCGGCNNNCSNGTCQDGACLCIVGYVDCNNDPKDGCEAQLAEDPQNCGACGHDCLGGLCEAGACQPMKVADLPAQANDPFLMVAASGYVYLLTSEKKVVQGTVHKYVRVFKAPAAGGQTELFFEEESDLSDFVDYKLASDGEKFYWMDKKHLNYVSLTDPADRHSFDLDVNYHVASPLEFGGGYVYWFKWTHPEAILQRLELATGKAESLSWASSTVPTPLSADAQGVYTVKKTNLPDLKQNGFFFLPHQGAPQKVLDFQVTEPGTAIIAVEKSAHHLVWGAAPYGELYSLPLSGQVATMLADKGATYFTIDDEAAYWLDRGAGSVYKRSFDGSAKITLAAGLSTQAHLIADDDDAVYWIGGTNTVKQIMRVAK